MVSVKNCVWQKNFFSKIVLHYACGVPNEAYCSPELRKHTFNHTRYVICLRREKNPDI